MSWLLPDGLQIWKSARNLYQSLLLRRSQRAFEVAKTARQDSRVVEFLEFYYDLPAIRIDQQAYPVTIVKKGDEYETLDGILGKLNTNTRVDFVSPDPQYRNILLKLSRTLYDGRTYVMDEFVDGKMNCSLGYYYDALTTCDALEFELLRKVDIDHIKVRDFPKLAKSLKHRNSYKTVVHNPSVNGRGRSAAIGLSTLIVFKLGNDYRCLVRMRAKETATHQELLHVLPSAMFQPEYGYIDEEYSVQHNNFREYLEEVFGKKELEHPSGALTYNYFYSAPELQVLRQLLSDKRAELILTGYTMNLLNLRPEICSLLLIHDPEWCKQDFGANWEFMKFGDIYEHRQDVLPPIEISRSNRDIVNQIQSMSLAFVPPGAAAFWLGIEKARQLT